MNIFNLHHLQSQLPHTSSTVYVSRLNVNLKPLSSLPRKCDKSDCQRLKVRAIASDGNRVFFLATADRDVD